MLFLLPAGEEVVVLSSVAAEAALEMGKAVRSSLLLAGLVGVGAGAGAGAVAEGRKCWRRLLWCLVMGGEAGVECSREREVDGCFNREQGTPVWLPILGAKNPNGRVAARNEEMLCAGSTGRG